MRFAAAMSGGFVAVRVGVAEENGVVIALKFLALIPRRITVNRPHARTRINPRHGTTSEGGSPAISSMIYRRV